MNGVNTTRVGGEAEVLVDESLLPRRVHEHGVDQRPEAEEAIQQHLLPYRQDVDDHHVGRKLAQREPAQYGERQPDLLAVGEQRVVPLALAKARPRQECVATADALDQAAQPARAASGLGRRRGGRRRWRRRGRRSRARGRTPRRTWSATSEVDRPRHRQQDPTRRVGRRRRPWRRGRLCRRAHGHVVEHRHQPADVLLGVELPSTRSLAPRRPGGGAAPVRRRARRGPGRARRRRRAARRAPSRPSLHDLGNAGHGGRHERQPGGAGLGQHHGQAVAPRRQAEDVGLGGRARPGPGCSGASLGARSTPARSAYVGLGDEVELERVGRCRRQRRERLDQRRRRPCARGRRRRRGCAPDRPPGAARRADATAPASRRAA